MANLDLSPPQETDDFALGADSQYAEASEPESESQDETTAAVTDQGQFEVVAQAETVASEALGPLEDPEASEADLQSEPVVEDIGSQEPVISVDETIEEHPQEELQP